MAGRQMPLSLGVATFGKTKKDTKVERKKKKKLIYERDANSTVLSKKENHRY